jgi:hypothetical protein
MKYIVNVGNVGNIECTSWRDALKTYTEYVRQSKGLPCRAHQEDVCIIDSNGEPVKEFYFKDYKRERLETNVNLAEAACQRARDILEEYKLEEGLI